MPYKNVFKLVGDQKYTNANANNVLLQTLPKALDPNFCVTKEKKELIRNKNPRENASFISKILFLFACTTFRKGLRKDFEEKDIYEIHRGYESITISAQLEKEWEKEKKKATPGLFIPLFKICGTAYLCWGVVYLVLGTSFKLSQPLLKGKIISYFAPDQTELTEQQVHYYSAALCIVLFLHTITTHAYAFGIREIVLKTKVAVTGLIYRKALLLSSTFMSKDSSGQAITLITKDIETFEYAMLLFHKLWVGVIQICIVIYIMYGQIGVSALVGISAVIVPLPFQGFLGKKIFNWRIKTAEKTDQRVRKTQELLTAIRTIKMYTWELFFEKIILALRKKEIFNLRILLYLKALILSMGLLNAKLGLYFCIITYVALGNHITAEKAFVVTGCFGTIQATLSIFIPLAIAQMADLKASMNRILAFLLLEEVDVKAVPEITYKDQPQICIKNSTVVSKQLNILTNISMKLEAGLTTITGSIGAGKSTLIKLIVGDLGTTTGSVEVCGDISYASQEPWLFPGSIKQNIIFNETFDMERYQKVVKVCALSKDLEILPEGDRTRITDKGSNLSRGQKTRINLARALYKVANIYLLDDCLSSVDGHVGKHIFYECKKFLKDSICMLVTHQELFLRESDSVIILKNGRLEFCGNYESLKNVENEEFKLILNKCENVVDYEEAKDEINTSEDHKSLLNACESNVYDETVQEGNVSKKIYKAYLNAGGGIVIFIVVLVLSATAQAVLSWSDYFVSFWVDLEQEMSGFRLNETTNSKEFLELEEHSKRTMILYSVVVLLASAFTLARSFLFFYVTCKASINIHKLIINKIINASITFFNYNLSGNVLNRLSRDLAILDEYIPQTLFYVLKALLFLTSTLFVISTVNTIFLIPSAFFLLLLYFGRNIYLPTSRSIRRLEGSTRSPLIGHFNSTLDGLTTIRANSAEKLMKHQFDEYQDVYNSVRYMHFSTTAAFAFYLDVIGNVFVMCVVLTFLIFKSDTLVGRIGLAITQSFGLTKYLEWSIRQWAEIENQMTSAERVLEYQNIDLENTSGSSIEDWPDKGKIVFNHVSIRYHENHKPVLDNVNFVIEPKQKIGVVGRTGAGKTTIISALYRLYDFEGDILIDSINIKDVEIHLLRKRISIIPQDPVLFTGSIRNNLDPNEEFNDKALWEALEQVDLKKVILDLDFMVDEGGSNFSVGQRQLICLARALTRNNNILILDEATANMDPHTDRLIQKTIREKFCNCTVVTIAHRLNTIMDSDKILVLDFGTVIEYDTPLELLNNKNGVFYNMVRNVALVQ